MEQSPASLDDWINELNERLVKYTTIVKTTEERPDIDPHLFHLWKAQRGLMKRWKKNKHNRKLKARTARLSVAAQQYTESLTRNNWHSLCERLSGRLGMRSTWALLWAQHYSATGQNHLLITSQPNGQGQGNAYEVYQQRMADRATPTSLENGEGSPPSKAGEEAQLR